MKTFRLRIQDWLKLVWLFIAIIAGNYQVIGQDVKYMPGYRKYANSWTLFYNGNHEPDLPKPLIKAGKRMVPFICEAVRHPDMKFRRYAISALGQIGDKSAVPMLQKLLNDPEEIEYFRGDALMAIYRIDRNLGVLLSATYIDDSEYLKMIADRISVLESKRSK